MSSRRRYAAASVALISVLAFTACASESEPEASEPAASSTDENYYPVTVTDLAGNEVTIESADSVAITDNRFFQIAAEWDVPVTTAPLDLFSPNNPLADSTDILNIGSHREPDFEQVVAADPDLIINGYRFADSAEDMQEAAPDAAFVSMDGPEDQGVDDYMEQSLTLMGEIFNREDEAAQYLADFRAAVDDAQAAYDPEVTVMGLVTSGGDINYANPTDGRGASVFFDLLDLTPALESEGSEVDTGDEISLEAIAGAQADFFLVLDRSAAVQADGEEVTPALELVTGSPSLANVPAVVNDAIYVMPADYYLTEDVFAYTAVLEGLTESFSSMS